MHLCVGGMDEMLRIDRVKGFSVQNSMVCQTNLQKTICLQDRDISLLLIIKLK